MDGHTLDRLEDSELVVFPSAPFELPGSDDREFLASQHVGWGHKNISFDPSTGTVKGSQPGSAERLRSLMCEFSDRVTGWLSEVLPEYARAWQLDLATLRPEEEATRRLRQTARNDLLHVDNFPSRPSFGRRVLRVYANLDVNARVWATSEKFPRLLERFARRNPIPALHAEGWVRPATGLFRRRAGACEYDALMQRLHHSLKQDDDFQERAAKRLWELPPGSVWLLFADSLSHAVLRGSCAVEHSFFVPVPAMRSPEKAPLSQLSESGSLKRAA